METPAIELIDLVKRYPKSTASAVDGLSFAVEPGEIFGLLGPNGAGKSTTIGVLTTRVTKTAGQAIVVGVDVQRRPILARSLLSVVPQRDNFDLALNARQNLLFHAAYHGVPRKLAKQRADALLDAFGLLGQADDNPAKYSGGMAQRLLIARALMHAPRVLFLDEPTTGLDPAARLFVWDRIRQLRRTGVTVLLTTHAMEEASELSDRVGILDQGKLIALDTPEALTRSLPGRTTIDLSIRPARGDTAQSLIEALESVDGDVERVERLNVVTEMLRARLYLAGDAPRLLGPISHLAAERKAEVVDVSIGRPSLEDVFIRLTGRDLR